MVYDDDTEAHSAGNGDKSPKVFSRAISSDSIDGNNDLTEKSRALKGNIALL